MRVYHSMPTGEFIAALRDGAIKSKQSPLVIDAIDRLGDTEENDALIEALNGQISELESEIIDLKEKLELGND